MKALLLRVGIDKGSGGSLGPIFNDGSFEYVPIPEAFATAEQRTYAAIIGRSSKPLAEFVRPSLRNQVPHFDPGFVGFTYRDPTRTKREQYRRYRATSRIVYRGHTSATDAPIYGPLYGR